MMLTTDASTPTEPYYPECAQIWERDGDGGDPPDDDRTIFESDLAWWGPDIKFNTIYELEYLANEFALATCRTPTAIFDVEADAIQTMLTLLRAEPDYDETGTLPRHFAGVGETPKLAIAGYLRWTETARRGTTMDSGATGTASQQPPGMTAGVAPPEPEEATKSGNPIILPDEFYAGSERLEHIRVAAWARMTSPTAVVASVLTMVCARTSPRFQLPPLIGGSVGHSLFVVLVAGVGAGKSTPVRCAQELLDDDAPDGYLEWEGSGTGEGVIDAHFETIDKVKQQTVEGLWWFIDEGSAMVNELQRKGSNLASNLCTAWMGGGVGQLNAQAERRRSLPRHSYSWGLLAVIQENLAAGLLDQQAVGFTQRMVWVHAFDPTGPDTEPVFPGTLGWVPPKMPGQLPGGLQPPRTDEPRPVERGAPVIVDIPPWFAEKIKDDRRRQNRGQLAVAPLEEHQNLKLEKLAFAIALLHGRVAIIDDDIRRAQIFLDVVDRPTRQRIQSSLVVKAESERTQAAIESTEKRNAEYDLWVGKVKEIILKQCKAAAGEEVKWGYLPRHLRNYVKPGRLSKDDALEIACEGATDGLYAVVGQTEDGYPVFRML